MKLERYGLTQPPFPSGAEATFLPLESRLEPLERIEQTLLEGRGIAVLTSASGLGKTTLCRELARRNEQDWLVAHLQDCGCTTRRSLLQALLYELGLPYTGLTEQEARLRLQEAIRDRQPRKTGLLLLADEAQRLNDRLLEELRSISNCAADGALLVRLLLCGDLVLEERLIDRSLESVNQRVVCHESLPPLSYEESAQLIDGRIVQAGGDGWEHVFTRTALELMCVVSDGSPRNLEQLGRRSLQIADQAREPRVSVEAVRQGLDELKELPLQWNEPANLEVYSRRDAAADETVDVSEALRADWDELGPDAVLTDVNDAIAVRVGDELPAVEHQALPAAAMIEFGGEEALTERLPPTFDAGDGAKLGALFTRSTFDASIFDDDVSPGLEDTAVLELGAHRAPPPTLASPSTLALPAAQQPDWIEIDVDDHYAALDTDGGPVALPPVESGLRLVRPSAPVVVAVSPTIELEQKVLDEVNDLSQQLAMALADSGNHPAPRTLSASDPPPPALESSPWCAGFSAMPEWDVVQPEWVADVPFTPVEISTAPHVDIVVAANAIPITATMESSPGAFVATAIGDLIATQTATDSPEIEELSPAASPAIEPCRAPASMEFAVADEAVAPTDQHLQLDAAGRRPYAQLFSRLRRLRSSVSERLRFGG